MYVHIQQDDDDGEENANYLYFAYLTGNTTCRTDSSSNSCYASIFSDPVYDSVSTAFVSFLMIY